MCGLTCPEARGILPDLGSDPRPCLGRWTPLDQQGSASFCCLRRMPTHVGAAELLRPQGVGWGEATPAPAHAPAYAGRYGQMTAGSYCYIGPQGIVHGTVVSGGPWGRGTGGLSERGW